MSIEMASSPSDIPSSSTTSYEILPIEEDTNHSFSSNNPTQIAMSDYNTNNKVIKKPPTGVVVDHQETKSESLTVNFLRSFKSEHKNSKSKSIHNKPPTNSQTRSSTGNSNSNEPRSNDDDNRSRSVVVEALSKLIGADLDSLDKTLKRMRKYEDQIKDASENLKKLTEAGGSEEEFRELKRIVMKLKKQIFSMREDEPEGSDALLHMWTDAQETPKNPAFEQGLDSKEFWRRYGELDAASKFCLLCFSVFPENAEIKKRVMIYWWIVEGFATTKQSANEFFNKLIVKGFIEPVCKKRSGGVDICKMDPLVRSLVIDIAQKFNSVNVDDASATPPDLACLTGKGLAKIQLLEKLALFNVNEVVLVFNPTWFSKMQNASVLYLGRWQTSPMHHIRVVDTTAMNMNNANVLDGLENLKHLRFLSLQGISRIAKLPNSISKLGNLTILDLRACHNLEIIPDGIGLLKNLTHLDMSECYLLDQMPKGLSLLFKLQVLSGFVVGDSESKNSCTLEDLQKLPELRKLSIRTGHDVFPLDRDLRALNQFKKLTKLTIAWGRGSVEAKKDDSRKNDIGASEQAIATTKKPGLPKALTRLPTSKQSSGTLDRENIEVSKKKEISAADQAAATSKKVGFAKNMRRLSSSETVELPNAELPPGLIKLNLQSFPGMVTPPWLRAFTLTNLKKLYIRGGKFSDLGQFKELDDEELEKDKWKVEELRLKCLTDLEMDWRELQELFPDLTYLEKVNCPKLTFFPCDESGVWMNKTMGDKQLQQMAS